MINHSDRVRKAVKEKIEIVKYDPAWPETFEEEKRNLLSCLTGGSIRRIEHFGGTAVPGMASKPVIDMLVEVASLEETRRVIAPLMESLGYEYFWRPVWGDMGAPFYAWFIKRNRIGTRTHHIHMVEKDSELWERLLFRDYLREFPDCAREYQDLKIRLAVDHPNDRVGYTLAKTAFIVRLTEAAKKYYLKP